MKSVLKVVLGVILSFIIILVGITACTSSIVSDIEKETAKEKTCLVIQNSQLVDESNEYFTEKYIRGTVKNTCDESIGYVEVEATTFDVDGNQLDGGFGIDNINDLRGQGTWNFEIWVDDNTNTYELKVTNDVFE